MSNDSPYVSSTRAEAVRAEVRCGDLVTLYMRAGVGRPIVLLRAASAPGDVWNELSSRLAERFRVLVPDVAVERAEFADWLRGFFDGLGLTSVSLVVDESLGVGVIGCALLDLERVERLVLLTAADSEATGLEAVISDADRRETLPLLVVLGTASADELAERITRFLSEASVAAG
jgi:pimeloyl-ACP methyl ester carboxylesterase